ncbi:MAG: TolB family protein [Syntrophobacteraceae bacterium]
MRIRILLMVLVTFACVPEVASAQTLYIEGGNVHFKADSSKSAVQLTTSGKDEQATLSPDGQMAAFVRRTPEKTIKAGVGPTEATELWSIRVDGTEAKLIVAGRSAAKMDSVPAAFRDPQFSGDGKRIYFLSAAWVTSAAVHVVDVKTGAEHFVCPGNSLEILRQGHYAGHLLITQHRYFLAGGSFNWIWLFTPDGREVGPVADSNSSDVEERLEDFRHM